MLVLVSYRLFILKEYTKYFDELESRKRTLQQAEQLFDNPLADFSTFNRAKSDFQAMDQIYKIYKAQKNARELWAKTLWVNLNPQALVDGIEQFFKEYRWIYFLLKIRKIDFTNRKLILICLAH